MAYTHNNKNNNNNKNYEDEGVFYTPSGDFSDSFDSFENYGKNKKNKKNIQNKTPKKLPPQKSKYSLFMALAVGGGIIVFIVLFIIMFNAMSPESGSKKSSSEPLSEDSSFSAYENKDNFTETAFSGNEYLGVIRLKSDSFKTLTIYNIDSSENSEYTVTGGTLIYDKYGKSIIFEELSEGDLINFVFDGDNTLVSIKKSESAFSETLKSGYKIDTAAMTISTNSKIYSYSEMTKFMYHTQEFSPDLIDPSIDTITISGIENNIWNVTLDKGHGELEVKQNSKIKNGIIEIGTSIYRKLTDIDTVKLNEGSHKIVVKGDNIEAFSKEIPINVNETSVLDLNTIPIKTGEVTIRPNVSDYTLYINGNIETSREPLTLEYGSYTIEVEKYGYIKYSGRFTLNSPEKVITPSLSQEVKMGSLSVNSTPSGANLYLDGISVGVTPYSSDVLEGPHSITLKKDGYKDITISSVYISEQGAVYNVDLQVKTD